MARSLENTLMAWTLGSAVGKYHPGAGILLSAICHSLNQQKDPMVAFPRRLDSGEVALLGAAKYLPFIPALALHACFIERGKDGKGPLPAVERALERPFKWAGARVGGPAGRAIGDVPMGFIAMRGLAQNASSAAGCMLAAAYLEHFVFRQELQAAPSRDAPKRPFSVAAAAAGAAAFTPVIGLLATQRGGLVMAALPRGVRAGVVPVMVPSLCVLADWLVDLVRWWDEPGSAA